MEYTRFYYKNYEYHDVLIPIGYVESGMNLLTDRGDDFTVTIALYNESVYEFQQEINNITITSDLLAFDLLDEAVGFLIEISE